jgi:hypothetical protein
VKELFNVSSMPSRVLGEERSPSRFLYDRSITAVIWFVDPTILRRTMMVGLVADVWAPLCLPSDLIKGTAKARAGWPIAAVVGNQPNRSAS